MTKAELLDKLNKLKDCPDDTEVVLVRESSSEEYHLTDGVEVAYVEKDSEYMDAIWDEEDYADMEEGLFKANLKRVILICEQ